MTDSAYRPTPDPLPVSPAFCRQQRTVGVKWESLDTVEKHIVQNTWTSIMAHFCRTPTPFPLGMYDWSDRLVSYVYDALWNEGWALEWVHYPGLPWPHLRVSTPPKGARGG